MSPRDLPTAIADSVLVSGTRRGVLRFSELHGWVWISAEQFALRDQSCELLHCRVLTVAEIRRFFADDSATFDGFRAEVSAP